MLSGITLIATACAETTDTKPVKPVPISQLPDVDTNAVLAHTRVLSSDEFEGRGPVLPAKNEPSRT